jgi:hypothetical protein
LKTVIINRIVLEGKASLAHPDNFGAMSTRRMQAFSYGAVGRNTFYSLLIPVLFFCVGCASGKKNYDPALKYPATALQEDASALWATFKECHPSLYWYSSQQEVDAAFDQLIHSLRDSLTEQQFRLKIAEALAHIHCGHTSVRGSKAAQRYRQKHKELLFPLQVKIWDKDSMAILANAHREDSVLVRGVLVHSINGRPVADIVDTLCRFISSDGLHHTFNYQLLSNNFPSWYKAIIGLDTAYALSITDKDGKPALHHIKNFDPALSDSLLKAAGKKVGWIRQNPAPTPIKRSRFDRDRSLRIDSANSLAIMELNTFGFARLHHFFHKTFRQLEKLGVKNLAIELRENGGGNIVNSTLLTRYISDHRFKVADTVAAVSFNYPVPGVVKHGLAYKIQSWFVARRREDGRLHYRMYERKNFTPKKHHHFDGQVFIITGGFTFSASNLFINPLKGQKNVTVLGEETGGGAYGNSAVNIPDIWLPNTKVRVRLPLYRIVINKDVPKDGSGILPDVFVPPTSWHLAHRLDPKMAKVYELIKQRESTIVNREP